MYKKIKISEIDLKIVKSYLKLDEDCDDDDVLMLSINAAIDYIKGYTNLPIETLDKLDSITIAALILIGDFYENRGLQLESNSKINRMLGSILSMNRDLG